MAHLDRPPLLELAPNVFVWLKSVRRSRTVNLDQLAQRGLEHTTPVRYIQCASHWRVHCRRYQVVTDIQIVGCGYAILYNVKEDCKLVQYLQILC